MDSTQKKQLRAAIYCRISQADGEVAKVEIQRRDCIAHAERGGYVVVAVYVDDGISAYSGRARPDYLQMLRDAEAGRFDVIVATFEDRLSRRPEEKLALAGICRETGIVWDTIHDGILDPSNADDKLFAYIRGWVGEKEQTQKIDRLRARFADRRSQGMPLWGVRPFGFENNRIDHRADEAAEVQWAYEHILNGGTVYAIMKHWNEAGLLTTRGNKWSNQSVKQLLRRPRNAGLMEDQGRIIEDHEVAWRPLVNRESWDEVCAILTSPSRSTVESREPRWLCAGLARCGVCGDILRSATGSDRKASFPIYRCARKGRTATTDGLRHTAVKTADLDLMVRDAIVSAFLLGPTSLLPDAAPEVAELRRIEKRLRAIRQEQDKVTSLIDAPGVSIKIIKEKAGVLHEEEQALLAALEECRRRSAHAAMLAGSAVKLFSGKRVSFRAAVERRIELESSFDELCLADQRTLVRNLLGITVYPGRNLERIDIELLWKRGQGGGCS